MEIKYKDVIANITKRPSDKYIIFSLPFYMYRIETNSFSFGLNYFQQCVLKLKGIPGMRDEQIAKYLSLETKFISHIRTQLVKKDFFEKSGILSDKGKEQLRQIDEIIIDDNEKKIGYIFRFIDRDEFYPFYINEVKYVDIADNKKHPKLIFGDKNDGTYFTEKPHYVDNLQKIETSSPSPTVISRIIENSNTKIASNNCENNSMTIKDVLQLRIIGNPELKWVCFYVYLKKNASKDGYDPEWTVLDPFGFDDNYLLKYYLASVSKELTDVIENRFVDVEIISGELRNEYYETINKIVEKRISECYRESYKNLDGKMKEYLKNLERFYIEYKESDNNKEKAAHIILIIQKIFEKMILDDLTGNRNECFQKLKLLEHNEKFNILKKVFDKGIMGTFSIRNLENPLKEKKPVSLKSYLAFFIISYEYDRNSILFESMKDKIDEVVDIANLRNINAHHNNKKNELDENKVNEIYSFSKDFIIEYANKSSRSENE